MTGNRVRVHDAGVVDVGEVVGWGHESRSPHCSWWWVKGVLGGFVRLDKWLWVARFFKTRSMAAKACDLGRVECNSVKAKPAKEVKVGDMLRVKSEAGVFEVEVLGLAEMRGPAALAQRLYGETAASLEARRVAAMSFDGRPSKPSKKDRREILRVRGQ